MLIINPGMQKSGSAYLYNLINELVVAADGTDAGEVKKKYKLGWLMRQANNNIGRPFFWKLFLLWLISIKEAPFVVKTHSGPTLAVKLFNALGLVKIIYIYRDPRDVMLSAIDHGKRIRAQGESHTFASFTNIDIALKNTANWVKRWERYNKMPGTLMIKYEDLLSKTGSSLAEIAKHLDISRVSYYEELTAIIWKYNKSNNQTNKGSLHLNKAKAFRYKHEMDKQDLEKINNKLGEKIKNMGYDVVT